MQFFIVIVVALYSSQTGWNKPEANVDKFWLFKDQLEPFTIADVLGKVSNIVKEGIDMLF